MIKKFLILEKNFKNNKISSSYRILDNDNIFNSDFFMKKMILVLTEDLLNGVIKSQVLTHIKFLKFHKIVDTQILFCYWDEKILKDQKRKKKLLKISINLK